MLHARGWHPLLCSATRQLNSAKASRGVTRHLLHTPKGLVFYPLRSQRPATIRTYSGLPARGDRKLRFAAFWK